MGRAVRQVLEKSYNIENMTQNISGMYDEFGVIISTNIKDLSINICEVLDNEEIRNELKKIYNRLSNINLIYQNPSQTKSSNTY